jgi:hypothetical protein
LGPQAIRNFPAILGCGSTADFTQNRLATIDDRAGIGHRLAVWMQVALGGHQAAVTGDLPEAMQGNTRIGHPHKPGVPQAVML